MTRRFLARFLVTVLLVAGTLLMGGEGWAGELLNMHPQSMDEAMQQMNRVTEEGRQRTEHYLEQHRQEETNRKLNDIEDAIIFNGLNNDDD